MVPFLVGPQSTTPMIENFAYCEQGSEFMTKILFVAHLPERTPLWETAYNTLQTTKEFLKGSISVSGVILWPVLGFACRHGEDCRQGEGYTFLQRGYGWKRQLVDVRE